MPPEMLPAPRYAEYESQFREEQLVRPDGGVLISIVAAPGQKIMWWPEPEFEIWGPCYGRVRLVNPVSQWLVIAYFPEGYPGPTGPFPQEAIDEHAPRP